MAHRWLILVAGAIALTAPAPARAAWPGAAGRIAFDESTDRGTAVRTSGLDGRHVRRLATVPPLPAGLERVSGGAQWTPDGRRLVYRDGAVGVRTMRADGRGKRLVVPWMEWPTWAPDGGR